jgi:AcrR family transcriptional regulator
MATMAALPTRERILEVTARLLVDSGGEPISIRDVCAAAGVGAPTVYHHFGDKQGLLDAVVAHGFERYVGAKRAERPSDDPLADLRAGWDAHTEFAVANPAFYALMYGTARPGHRPAAAEEAQAMLEAVLRRVEETVGLRMDVPAAARLLLAGNVGVGLALVTAEGPGDLDLSTRMRDSLIASIVREVPSAVAPPELFPAQPGAQEQLPLTAAERALLREWLARPRG